MTLLWLWGIARSLFWPVPHRCGDVTCDDAHP